MSDRPFDDKIIAQALSAQAGIPNVPVGPPANRALDDQILQQALGGPSYRFGADGPSYLGGFIKSMVHGGTTGLIGRDPDEALWDPETVGRFAQQYPMSSLFSEILGSAPIYFIPFAGEARGASLGIRLSEKLPGLARLAEYATNPVVARSSPKLAAAAKEVARFAPLEVARVAGAALDQATNDKGDEGLANTLGQVAFEIPLMAATGAVAKILRGRMGGAGRAVGEEQQIQDAFDFYNLNGTPQERLRQLSRAQEILREKIGVPEGQPLSADVHGAAALDLEDLLKRVGSKLEDEILTEAPEGPNTYIRRLVGDSEKSPASIKLNKLLKEGSDTELQNRSVTTRTFERGKYGSSVEGLEELQRAGITPKELPYVQFPRSIETTTAAGSRRVESALRGAFKRVGSLNGRAATWIAKEADGLFVVVKRVANKPRLPAGLRDLPKNIISYARGPERFTEAAIAEAEKAASFGDRYVVFRTDQPLRFHKSGKEIVDALMKGYRALRPPSVHPLEPQVGVLRNLRDLIKAMPEPEEMLGAKPRAMVNYLKGWLGMEESQLAQHIGTAADYLGAEAKAILSPGLYQFNKSQRAMRINSIVRALYNRMNAEIQASFFGVKDPSKAASLFGQLFEIPSYKGGIYGMMQDLSQEEMQQLSKALQGQMSIDEVRAANMSKKVVDFLRVAKRSNDKVTAETEMLHEIARDSGLLSDVPTFTPIEGHYGVSRSWRGSFRQEIVDEAGNRIGYGSGYSAKQAKDDAEALVTAARAEGVNPRPTGEAFRSGRDRDLSLATGIDLQLPGVKALRNARVALQTRPPSSLLNPRTGMLGAVGQFQAFSKKELKDIMLGHLIEMKRQNANLAIKLKLGDDLNRLKVEYPELHKQLINRINARAGHRLPQEKGGVIDAIEKGVDRFLGPYLGNNSASQIANVLNEGMFHLTLLMGDMGFVALNAVTPVMTGLPEIAYMLTAPPERLAKDYTVHLIGGRTGAMRSMWSLDPLKILGRSFKRMAQPTAEDRAFFERAIKEGIVDPKFVEEFTGQGQTKLLLGPMGKDMSWTEWLRRLVEFPAAKSEELSRGMSFQMGLMVGKDYFGLEGESLFQLAREFTERTQYLYSTADRGQIITGPLGKVFGLFKNWSMHQIATLARYGGEGFLDGNFAPLLWGAMGTGAIGGLPAVTGYSVADQFSRTVSDKGLMQNTYDALGYNDSTPQQFLADTLFYGLPGGLFGISMQSRASASGADPIRDLSMLGNIALLDRMKWGAEFLGEALNRAEVSGTHPINSRDVLEKFMRFAAPRTIYRSMSFNQDGYLKSLKTQGALTGKFSWADRVLYAVGMPNIETDKFYAVADEAQKNQDVRRNGIMAYGDALAEARMAGDFDRQRALISSAISAGLPVDSILRSAESRVTVQSQGQIEREFKDTQTRMHSRAIGLTR